MGVSTIIVAIDFRIPPIIVAMGMQPMFLFFPAAPNGYQHLYKFRTIFVVAKLLQSCCAHNKHVLQSFIGHRHMLLFFLCCTCRSVCFGPSQRCVNFCCRDGVFFVVPNNAQHNSQPLATHACLGPARKSLQQPLQQPNGNNTSMGQKTCNNARNNKTTMQQVLSQTSAVADQPDSAFYIPLDIPTYIGK